MSPLINGKLIAEKILKKTADKAAAISNAINRPPKLAVVLVGDDKPSQTYARRKGETAKKVGIEFELHKLPGDITMEKLKDRLSDIQANDNLDGLIVQLPLPEQLYAAEALNAIRPEIDVDCLTDVNLGKLVMRTNFIVPPTPGAVITILHELNISIQGKDVTIVGTGALVGKPLAIMMMNEGASVTTCNSRTKNNEDKYRQADILVTGVGKKDLIRGRMVKDGAVVIDTGVCFANRKMYGDVNVAEVSEKASFVTPTPGGVGPITVARLLWNTVLCAEKKWLIRNLS